MPNQTEKQKLKPIESVGIGAITGLVSATVYLPFWTLKMRHQCELPFTLNPLTLYKGYTTILGIMVPITMFQIFNASRVESIITNRSTVSSKERLISSFLGGASSALISNLLNLLGTQQHKHKHSSPLKAATSMMHQFGVRNLFVGLPTTAVGEGLFTFSFYGLFPSLKTYFKNHFDSELLASLSAGLVASIPTAVITQPLDRIKTMQHQQADEKNSNGKGKHGFIKCTRDLYKNNGIKVGFFKGFLPRTFGLTATILAAGTTAEYIESVYRKNI